MVQPAIWSDDDIAALSKLWCESEHSATAIARILSSESGRRVTKNAILGKVHRLGLTGRRPERKAKPSQAPIERRAKSKILALPFRAPSPAPRPPDPHRGSYRITDLRPGRCRFPSGWDFGHLFCGGPIERGSYCGEHAVRCYREPRIDDARENAA